jgi:hypothetical protein
MLLHVVINLALLCKPFFNKHPNNYLQHAPLFSLIRPSTS